MNFVDLIGILLLLFMGFWGMKKGLMRSVLGLGSLLLSLILSLTLYPAVSGFLENSPIGDALSGQINKLIISEQAAETNDVAAIPTNLVDSIQKNITDTVDKATSSIQETLSSNLSSLAVKLLAIILVFFAVKLILKLLTLLLNGITKLPVISSINHALGLVLGLGYGIFVIYIILAILTFTTTIGIFQKVTELILESQFVSEMYHHNILLSFLH